MEGDIINNLNILNLEVLHFRGYNKIDDHLEGYANKVFVIKMKMRIRCSEQQCTTRVCTVLLFLA
jgi:hypothetical protein